jgi:hypothetical protein
VNETFYWLKKRPNPDKRISHVKHLLVLSPLLFAVGCASVHRIDSTKFKVIPIPEGLKEASAGEDMQRRISQGETVILKVAEGEQMPFKLSVDLPVGALEKSESTFKFKHDTFFLLGKGKFYLSPDGQRWANVANPNAIAKLFGIKHGSVAFGFSSSTNESPFMRLEVEAK